MKRSDVEQLKKYFIPWKYPGIRELTILYFVVTLISVGMSLHYRAEVGNGETLAKDVSYALVYALLLVFVVTTVIKVGYLVTFLTIKKVPSSAQSVPIIIGLFTVLTLCATLLLVGFMSYFGVWGIPEPTIEIVYAPIFILGIGTFVHGVILTLADVSMQIAFLSIPTDDEEE